METELRSQAKNTRVIQQNSDSSGSIRIVDNRANGIRKNETGLPDNLKAGVESLSGFSLDNVRVHYNSSKPATVQALAYTQGTDIHVAPGQEKHLPHEAWHVAQQMAGRVAPTTSVNGMPVNDSAALEHEADVMGAKAVQCKGEHTLSNERKTESSIPQMSNAQNIASPKIDNCVQREGPCEILFNFFESCENSSLLSVFQKAKALNDENTKKLVLEFIFQNQKHIKRIVYFCQTVGKKLFDEIYREYLEKKASESGKAKGAVKSVNAGIISNDEIQTEFNRGVVFLCTSYPKLVSHRKIDLKYLDMNMNLPQIIEKSRQANIYTIASFVQHQIDAYKDNPARQLSALVLGVARKISYLLGDPWAENRIARLLCWKIQDNVRMDKKSSRELSGFSRSNPILMYVNNELNAQDACHLIRLRSIRVYGKNTQDSYNRMFSELRLDANVILKAMDENAGARLISTGGFDPASGMFRLYAKDRTDKMLYERDISELAYFRIENDRGFKRISDEAWKAEAERNDETVDPEHKPDKYDEYLNKLRASPITLRLHSSDLSYQKRPLDTREQWFYHSRPWFSSVKIEGKDIPYHPLVSRDGKMQYSLWRTYKDHYYRGRLWKRGKDGYPQKADDPTMVEQSFERHAIQQSFASLNVNYEQSHYGLLGGYDYGNVALVLDKGKLEGHCLYTIGDYGLPHSSLESVALALARGNELQIDGTKNTKFGDIKNALAGSLETACEHLEVQIFKDIKFGKNGDVKEIYCYGVTDEDYELLKEIAGEDTGGGPKVFRY